MNADHVPTGNSMLASTCTSRPRCAGCNGASGFRPSSWLSPFLVFLVALAALPAAVSAAPPRFRPRTDLDVVSEGLSRRDSNNSQSNGSISMTVWLPILVVAIVFVLFSLCTCVRRCAAGDAATGTNRPGASATTNRNTAGTTTTRPRRRPQRTPSQISTKSLPPYMKEPGDQELVLFRGPEESEDDHAPHVMPILAEDDEEHAEMHNETFGVALDRVESVDTVADSSTTNLVRRASASVPRPPELHHATLPHHHRRSGDASSLDSVGSEAELLAHQRAISTDSHPDPRGEAPSYAEAVDGRMATVSLNDPDPINATASNPIVPPLSHPADPTAGRGHSRFNFLLHNPFSSRNNASEAPSNANTPDSTRSESPALHAQAGSALSRFSSRESHETHHSRAPSGNGNTSNMHSRSNSNLFRAFRSHSPGLHAGSSTISLDSISAPLTHTVKRAEFYAPKGGIFTPEQVKLITSREAVGKFGMPYGPDAIAAYSLAREVPPPEFGSVAGEHQEEASGSGGEVVAETTAQTMGISGSDTAPQPSLPHQPDARAESHTAADTSDGDGQPFQAQTVQAYEFDDESGTGADEPRTARPLTPSTARPLSLSSRV